jgi:hypothetical protein
VDKFNRFTASHTYLGQGRNVRDTHILVPGRERERERERETANWLMERSSSSNTVFHEPENFSRNATDVWVLRLSGRDNYGILPKVEESSLLDVGHAMIRIRSEDSVMQRGSRVVFLPCTNRKFTICFRVLERLC